MKTPAQIRLKYSFILLIAGCLIYATYIIYGIMNQPSTSGDKLAEVIRASDPIDVKAPTIQNTAIKNNAAETTSTVVSKPLTLADVAEFQRWSTEHGYIPEEDIAVYKSYSDEMLEDLAKRGDVIALEMLGGKFINQHDYKKAKIYYRDAAALGSTIALDMLAIITETLPVPNETKAQRKELVRLGYLESLALYKVIALRGNQRLADSNIRSVDRSYLIRNKEPLNLKPEELEFINQRAQEIYSDLQARRTELGLGDFNNTTPLMLTDIMMKMKQK